MVKIGLEIHGYLDTEKKLFCNCDAVHGAKFAKPNTKICPICTAQPGCKPMLPNKEAVKKATQIAILLGCKVNKKLVFYRKHYSWPDLPKGYQNTISGPHAVSNGEKGKFEGIGIWECHLEEDPAAWNPDTGEIDYNRSGSPLIEIVTAPDFSSSEQVVEWLKQLIATLSYIKAIDKKAGIKADVNISIDNGERVELKNINSLQNIKDSIEIEIKRQEKDLPREKHTRRYDSEKRTTVLMRSKENADDYRFISDPDLPAIILEEDFIKKLKKDLPETPKEKLEKLIKKYKIPKENAEILTKKLEIVEFFEKIVEHTDSKLAIRYITEELLSVLNYNRIELEDTEIIPEHFIKLLNAIKENKITELKAKDILRTWKEKSSDPEKEIKANASISDFSKIEDIAKKVILENSKAVQDYQLGEEKSINFLIGQLMRLTNKRADFKTAKEVLEKLLK
jgi:aspartyl-tRNA(Asn)/glutamyl-tRNA(Gln) amidotransferase subunit B